jgi:hypothetical protein
VMVWLGVKFLPFPTLEQKSQPTGDHDLASNQ